MERIRIDNPLINSLRLISSETELLCIFYGILERNCDLILLHRKIINQRLVLKQALPQNRINLIAIQSYRSDLNRNTVCLRFQFLEAGLQHIAARFIRCPKIRENEADVRKLFFSQRREQVRQSRNCHTTQI